MPELKPRSDHSSGKWENFPAGLRVLVVDDDSLCLKVIGQMLRSCKYEVTTCMNSTTALDLLRDRRDAFDLVLSDVFMPDVDGFKLLETIGLEMGLPVIMMSSSGDTGVVLKGVTHGAVDFLIKPVRVEELRNIWQHVVRRRKELGKDIEVDQGTRPREDGPACESSRKRKETSKEGKGDDGCASKKPRVNWSLEMHQQFVNAVNQLGIDKAVPKKILELMSVKSLTRENVASHLQKYRLYLKRMRVEATDVRSATSSLAKPRQSVNQPAPNAAVPASGATANPGMFPAVPSPAGLLGAVPQTGIGNLIPTLGAPNLANMQMQLQNMHLQGALSLGVDASSLVPPAAMLPPGLGLGMGFGTLQAHAFMGMGLMTGVPDGNGSQFQGLQHVMSRSASVPTSVDTVNAAEGELRRHQSSIPTCGDTANGGVADVTSTDDTPCAGVAGNNASPVPNLSDVARDAMPTLLPTLAQLDSGALAKASLGQQGKSAHNIPAASGPRTNMQVKQEDTGTRNANQQLCENLDLKLLEGQDMPGLADATGAAEFASEETLLGLMGSAVNGDLGSFANGEFGVLGDGVIIEETKDTGMDDFLNAFLRETCAPNDPAGQC